MLFGFFFVHSFNDLLAMGVLLGIAGASFGVALSLGSGWFPPQHKGLAMGLVGAGNVGTAVSVLVAPPLAQWLGWQSGLRRRGRRDPAADDGDDRVRARSRRTSTATPASASTSPACSRRTAGSSA